MAKAQASLGRRNRSNDDNRYADSHESLGKIQASRDFFDGEALERRAGKKDTRDFLRTSKHAPTELSSKKAVPRKREVVPTLRINHRDPRFESFNGVVDEQKAKNNYSFLETYRDSEILELKSAIRKTKNSEGKEKLKHVLLSMESRKKVRKIKDQQQAMLRKHRKEEKEKIAQGKRPFYLKKADQKKMALIERFPGMKGKQIKYLHLPDQQIFNEILIPSSKTAEQIIATLNKLLHVQRPHTAFSPSSYLIFEEALSSDLFARLSEAFGHCSVRQQMQWMIFGDAVEDSLDSLLAKARRQARRAASATASRFQAFINIE